MKDNENRVPRMRTLPKAMEEIKKADPETQFTLATLRKLVDRGIIGCVPLGNYKLIVFDKLLALLSDGIAVDLGEEAEAAPPVPETVNGIRKASL